jgi:hypothetical protein
VANDNIKLKNTVGCFYRKKTVFNAYFLDDFWGIWTKMLKLVANAETGLNKAVNLLK